MKSMTRYLLIIAAQIALFLFIIWTVNKEYGAGVAEVVTVIVFVLLAFSAWAYYPRQRSGKS